MINEEYLKSLDDEIGADVYFYHNQINDKIDCFTVGCEISQWDGEKIMNMLPLEQLTDSNGYIFFNVCAVTESAQKVCERITERLTLVYPERKFFFMGCGVDYNKEFYKQYGTALTNQEKFNVANYGCTYKKNIWNIRVNKYRNVGYVKIEDGCDNNCAYCIIHKIRPHYMVSYEKIKHQINRLLSQGKRDIQLIGTEITKYNYKGLTLFSLCEKILEDYPEINSLVVGALDPASKEVDKIIELIKHEPRMFNSLYLCTQSCSDTILKKMRRRHTSNRLRELTKLADGKIDFVYQLIIGFPGETDELFQETLNFVKELKPIDIDTIPFSARKGTDAYDMPNKISAEVIANRERQLYDVVKSYSSFEDENQLRAMKPMNKELIDKFLYFNLHHNHGCLQGDIYGKEAFKRFFDELSKAQKENIDISQMYILTYFEPDKDIYDLDVNIKLLTSLFGVKVELTILLNDYTIPLFSNGYYTLENVCYRFCVYPEIIFDDQWHSVVTNASKEDLLKIFKTVYIYKLCDIDTMLFRLYKANKDYYKYISKELGIEI